MAVPFFIAAQYAEGVVVAASVKVELVREIVDQSRSPEGKYAFSDLVPAFESGEAA